MSDRFHNPNRTSVGKGIVTLIASGLSMGTEIAGSLEASVKDGIVVFSSLRISCPGLGFKLRMRYRRWLDGPMAIEENDVIQDSLPFNVGPAPPRLESVMLDDSWTRLLFVLILPPTEEACKWQASAKRF